MISDFFKPTDIVNNEDGTHCVMYIGPSIPVPNREKQDIDFLYPGNKGAFMQDSLFVDLPYWHPES